ncbi:MAG: response regulator [Nitrospina sp.]|jgi:two-component system, chemotaxis family, chemotaxis protein CheY|nr:response regulator [Nitrospina sp.]MBT3414164.1 response regulator [Nitrospina sp.]MBT3857045.1 response regulator [Nitrospina sp.]MBT4103604.1 response regulator [Nitrospina sp.]MBT4390317.1 response regulator [Nitrospina sp.]
MADDKQKFVKILVVEDDEASRAIIARFLDQLGFSNVVLAENGRAALNELNLNQIDLVISDWRMPDMDGLELYWSAKNEGLLDNTPFLMVSAENEKGKVIEALRAGVNDYIVKPVDSKTLKDKIEKLLSSQE